MAGLRARILQLEQAEQKAFWAGHEDARTHPHLSNIQKAWERYQTKLADPRFASAPPVMGITENVMTDYWTHLEWVSDGTESHMDPKTLPHRYTFVEVILESREPVKAVKYADGEFYALDVIEGQARAYKLHNVAKWRYL